MKEIQTEEMRSSDSGRALSPVPIQGWEEAEKGHSKEQDKREAQNAPHCASGRSDGGTPTRRQERRNRPTKSQYKGINSLAQDFGPSLLRMMDEDKDFMEEVDISIRNEHFLHGLAGGKSSGDSLLDGLVRDCRDKLSEAEQTMGISLTEEMREDAMVTMLKLAIIGMDEVEAGMKEDVANA